MRRAASLADCTAGNNREISTEMMAMTTSSSIKVNARRFRGVLMVLNQFSGWKISRRSARILASIDTIVPSNTITDSPGGTILENIDTIMAQTFSIENHLREHRARRGWSQEELARRACLSRAGISAIETDRLVPSAAAALALAEA